MKNALISEYPPLPSEMLFTKEQDASMSLETSLLRTFLGKHFLEFSFLLSFLIQSFHSKSEPFPSTSERTILRIVDEWKPSEKPSTIVHGELEQRYGDGLRMVLRFSLKRGHEVYCPHFDPARNVSAQSRVL